MPELPDILVYVEAIDERARGAVLDRVTLASPFLLRSVDPPIEEAHGKRVREVSRIGKRIVLGLEDDLFLVVHLMIAGRLHWKPAATAAPAASGAGRPSPLSSRRRGPLVAFEFSTGTLTLTEAGTKRRASLVLVRGADALAAIHRGGLDVMRATPDEFASALARENHTLKRALTDPRLFDGIGNAYSDEILHAARLSPLQLTRNLSPAELSRLHSAAREVLAAWTDRLRAEAAGSFPEKVTAFREGMAVHGRFGQPCPACGAPVQRIVYSENEANYCARCQTGGRLLADRALSRLLREDWPKRLEE